MKKAIIDVDDVLALDAFLNALNDFNKSNFKYEDVKGYYVESLIPEEKIASFRKFMREIDIYKYARVAPYSKEVLMQMMLEGYDIYPTSKYYSDIDKIIIPELIPYKCEFLQRNYPFIPTKNYIFINDKLMMDADLRIDDSISNLGGNGINLLFSAYHNKNIENEELENKQILRVSDWNDIGNKVLKKSIYKN